MYGLPSKWLLGLPVLLMLVAFAVSSHLPTYYLYLANHLMILVVLALGLDILLGRAGQFAFAHTAFFGVGCYTTSYLNIRFGIPFVVGLPIAAIIAAGVGILVAMPATRLRSVYLALATFAFAEGAFWVFNSWTSVTGGANGLRLPVADVFGFTISNDAQALPVIAILCATMILSTMLLATSRLARSFAAIRDSEHVALSSGINVSKTKVYAFVISAVFAAIAGSMYTLHQSYLAPELFKFHLVVLVLSMLVVGGLGTVPGVIIGVVLIGMLPELLRTVLRDLQIWQELIYGTILIVFVTLVPQGIWGVIATRIRGAKS